jgi:hypothetical protein
MKAKKILVRMIGCLSLLLFANCMTTGSAMLIGGSVVKGYVPSKILVEYEAEGIYPEGSHFYLIETESGTAFYQQDADGAGMIMETMWFEENTVNFSAAFFGYGPAYIYKVPKDRSKNAERYVYDQGTYQGTPGHRTRPMPNNPKEKPDATLIPKKIYDSGITHSQASADDNKGVENKSEKVIALETTLGSNDSKEKRNAAMKLYRSADFSDPATLDIVSQELLKGYNINLLDKYHVDAMAWLCKILGASGNIEYKSALEEAFKNSQSRKIRGYAEKNLKNFK